MSFQKMNFKWFVSKVNQLDFSSNDANQSYQYSYPYLINYFKDVDTLKKEHLVIGAHAVYGWMPTILNLKKHKNGTKSSEINISNEIVLLNKAKNGERLIERELDLLKCRINNSMVGLSKLLHFINPEKYPILDSKIYKFTRDISTAYGINKPKNYLEYLDGCGEIADNDGNFSDFRSKNPFSFEKKGAYSKVNVTDFRYIELSLFRVASLKAK